MKITFLKIISPFIILFLTEKMYAQQELPIPDDYYIQDTVPQQDTTLFGKADTSAAMYFYDYDFTHIRIADTLESVQRYDPVHLQEYGYYSLGDLGSPHRQLVYQPRLREGIDLGFHHYDLYLRPAHEIRFFNTPYPYSQIKYTAGPTQEEGYVNAIFAQNINNNISAAVDFSRMIHKGGYENQRVRHTNLGLSAWYRSSNGRYYSFLTWAGNSAKQQNNGGIQGDTLLLESIYEGNRDLIPVQLRDAQSEYDHNEFVLTQYFNIWRKANIDTLNIEHLSLPDSLTNPIDTLITIPNDSLSNDSLNRQPSTVRRSSPPPRPPSLGTGLTHRFRYKKELLRTTDPESQPASNPDFYGIFNTHELGLRHFLSVKKYENRFGAYMYLGKNSGFRFEPALTHAFVRLNQEPRDSTMQELRFSATVSTTISSILKADGYAHYELGANIGDYLLKGEAELKLGNLGTLEGRLVQHQYAPNLAQYRLFISQRFVWENDFKKTNETNFMVKYRLPKLQFGRSLSADISGGIQNHLLSNLIYYDSIAAPVQANELKNIAQIFITGNFRFGKFYSENKVVLQQTDDAFLRLPSFWSAHSIFFQDRLFKGSALVRFGADIRYNSNFQADNWQPLIGQFYRQNAPAFIFQPTTDVFLSFKVNRFRSFFKLGNLFQPLAFNTRLIAPDYPTRDFFFRFGLNWTFID